MHRVIEEAKKVLEIEAQAVEGLIKKLDEGFSKAVRLILECKGKVVVTGVGKSGIIAQKIAATLASTGTSSVFLHPVEGLHGSLGVVTREDVVLCLSNSGETEEILGLLPSLKGIGVKIIAFSGRRDSTLGQNADAFIDVGVEKEACPFGLVPTASTTCALALGDALAIVLLKEKGFKKEDFAFFHPRGVLGKRLLLRVEDVMRRGKANAVVSEEVLVKEALFTMTSTRLGATSVINKEGKLVGFLTDGDVRRGLQKNENFLNLPLKKVMTKNPLTIKKGALAVEALRLLREREVDNLPVVDERTKPVGMVDVQDLIKEGL